MVRTLAVLYLVMINLVSKGNLSTDPEEAHTNLSLLNILSLSLSLSTSVTKSK